MHIYAYGRDASSAEKRRKYQHQRLWDLVRDKITAEHRGLETTNPSSPRIKPTLGSSIGFIVAGSARR